MKLMMVNRRFILRPTWGETNRQTGRQRLQNGTALVADPYRRYVTSLSQSPALLYICLCRFLDSTW